MNRDDFSYACALRAAALLTALTASACAGFPHRQNPVQLTALVPLDGVPITGGGAWPDRQWWTQYDDAALNELVGLGAGDSPSLASAHARFEAAEQSVRLAAAAAGAHVDLNSDIERQRLSDNGLFSPRLLGFTWYNQADLGLQVKYTFDWWGKQKSAVQAAVDQAHAAQADRSAALLLLATSIADMYFGWQADENRLALAREKEATVLQQGEVTAARVTAELESADVQFRSDLALAAAREEIATLQGSAQLREVALAALVGKSVAELPRMSVRQLPAVPGALPDAVKIDLISRRADIVAARWRVQAAESNLASARAEFFPDISINALIGVQSVDIGKLLQYGSRVPMAEAALHLPIFDAGRIKAQYGAARASIDAAVSTYDDAVVSAARDVGTQVATLAQIDAQRKQRLLQVNAAERISTVAAAQVQQGLTDSRPELTAVESWIEQRDALLQLDSAALSAQIALQSALGGGYESAQKTAQSAVAGRSVTP